MSIHPDVIESLRQADLKVVLNAPLVKRTWWRAGGPADALVDVTTLGDLVELQRCCHAADVPVFVLGNASNLLISDAGIRGVVVRLTGDLAQCEVTEDELILGGGMKMTRLVSQMMKHGWTGLEFMAGIPGTVGGAVRMNAGTTLGEVVDALLSVTVVHPGGASEVLPVGALSMAYRTCVLPEGAIVATARFRRAKRDPDASREAIQHHLERRRATQPVDRPTCGSTFRNPEGDHAGRLVEAAGLKGFRIGGASVSEKHANFIENDGTATASEIRAVLEHVQAVVLDQFGVALHQEVHFAGDWS